MIQHFCFAKLRDEDAPDRDALARQLRGELLGAAQPLGAAVTVAVPADDTAKKWDLAIAITAASLAIWSMIEERVRPVFDALEPRAVSFKRWTFDAAPR